MFELKIDAKEGWDASKNEFVQTKATIICLEHSLVSLSKWEAHFRKPYLSTEKKTREEILYYVKCMTITQNVDPKIYELLSESDLQQINSYITDTATATWFNDIKQEGAAPVRQNKQIITSELIYYWMVSYQIPFECQKWHLNRLLTLIRICNVEEAKSNGKHGGKMSKRDILSQNRALNAARKQKLNTKG